MNQFMTKVFVEQLRDTPVLLIRDLSLLLNFKFNFKCALLQVRQALCAHHLSQEESTVCGRVGGEYIGQ